MLDNMTKNSAEIVMKGFRRDTAKQEQIEASVHAVIHTLVYGVSEEVTISPLSAIIRASCSNDFTTYRRIKHEKKTFDRGI